MSNMPKVKEKTGESGKPPGEEEDKDKPEPQKNPKTVQGWPVTPEYWEQNFPKGYCKCSLELI